MSLTYQQIAPTRLLNGIGHNPAPGAHAGFISDVWVPDFCKLETWGVNEGTLRNLDGRTDMQAGMEGMIDGVADGADRPQIEEFASTTSSWKNIRLACEKRDPVGRVPGLFNEPAIGADGRTAFERRRRQHEIQRARMLNTSRNRQKEFQLARKVWGTNLAGAGLTYESLNVTTMGASLFGGTAWDDPKAPLLDMLMALTDYACDKAKVDGPFVHLLMGETVARKWARNHQLKGLSLITEGADPVGFQAAMVDSRMARPALVGRLKGIDKLARVVIGGSRAGFSPKGGDTDVRFIHPDAIHLAVFVPPEAYLNDTTVDTSSTAMIETTGAKTGVRQKLDEAENNQIWFMDEWCGFNEVDANFGTTVFNV